MGRRNNQNLGAVPHARCIEMLAYKAQLVGMHVLITEESSTSKASFLPAPTFSGRRVKRGLYRAADGRQMGGRWAADGRHINADANGSYTIMRTVAPDAFAQGSSGCVVHPIRLAV